MGNGSKSKKHHWWPVGLQSYWADENGDVSWIAPGGGTDKKRYKNENIGQIRRGHALRPFGPWPADFEDDFIIDNEVHNIIDALVGLSPDGIKPGHVTQSFMDDEACRKLLLFALSLIIRIPSNRHRFELYPTMIGLPPNIEIGKANMNGHYRLARDFCKSSSIISINFTVLYSVEPAFTYGDGCLDWLSSGLLSYGINGKAILTLTPYIAIYINTPTFTRSNKNITAVRATQFMIDRLNFIVQMYSKNRVFFLGRKPEETKEFRANEFYEHADHTDPLLEELDAISGTKNKFVLI